MGTLNARLIILRAISENNWNVDIVIREMALWFEAKAIAKLLEENTKHINHVIKNTSLEAIDPKIAEIVAEMKDQLIYNRENESKIRKKTYV